MTKPAPFADYALVKTIKGTGTRHAELWRAVRAGHNSLAGQHCIRFFDTAKGGECATASYGFDADYLVSRYAQDWIATEPALWAIYSADGADNRDLMVIAFNKRNAKALWQAFYSIETDEEPDTIVRLPATPYGTTEQALSWELLLAA